MTTVARLWLGFGTLTALLLVSGTTMLVLTMSAERQFELLATTARERATEGREMEIGVLGHALGMRIYIQSGDDAYRIESQASAANVDRHLAEYTKRAETQAQRHFGAKFAELWKAFRDRTETVLANPRAEGNNQLLTSLAAQRRELIRYLDEQLQADAVATLDERKAVAMGHMRRLVLTGLILLVTGLLVAWLTAMAVARAILRTEREVRFERERLRATLASIGDGVITTDMAGRVSSINAVASTLTGWTNEQAHGEALKDVFRIINEETRAEVENPALRALEEGVVVGLANHTLLISKDGTERPIDDSAAPVQDAKGAALGSVLVFRDISQRREIERELQEQAAELGRVNGQLRDRVEELQLLLNSIPIGVFIAHDPACVNITCNPAGAALLAVPKNINVSKSGEHADRLPFRVMRGGVEMAAEDLPMQRAAREGRMVQGEEVDLVFADGRVVTLFEFAAPLFDASGKVRGCLGTFVDITERKGMEIVLRQAKDRLQLAAEAAALGIWSWDPRSDSALWENDETARIMGVSANEPPIPSGRFFEEFLHSEDRPAVEKAIARTVQDAAPLDFACRIRRPDGAWRHVECTGKAVPSEGGRIVGTVRDITDRTRGERMLVESELRYRTLFDSIDQGFSIAQMILDDAGKPVDYKILEGNPAFVRFTGLHDYRRGTVLEMIPDLEPWWVETYGHIAMTGESRRFEQFAAPMGKWFEVYAFRFGAPEQLQVAIFFKDISDRRLAVEALRASEERLQIAMAAGEAGAWDLDLVTGRNIWSKSHFTMLGYEPTPTMEVSEEFWRDRVLPEDLACVMEAWERAVREGIAFHSEHRMRRVDNGAIIWVRAAGRFLHDPATKRMVRFVGVLFDITQQKNREQAIKEMDRRKDEFLAMLSHELRNPLAPIRAALHLMRTHQPRDEHPIHKESREIIERQTATLMRLVGELLDVSRVVSSRIRLRREVVDLNDILRHALETSKPIIDAQRHTLTVRFHPSPLRLDVDPTRIEQVLVNLLNNAAKYTPDGGRIEVWSDQTVGADGTHHARVGVRDDGLGIEPELLPQIFGLFTQAERSLDRSQGGLGIGLSLCKRLIDQHGGTIMACSDGPGTGSTFTVELPLLDRERDAQKSPDPVVTGQQALVRGRILLVDDNADLVTMLSIGLRSRGFFVETASNGWQGLETAIAFRPDVLVLDIGLPGIDGYELARRLRADEQTKSIRLIALSGYVQGPEKTKTKAAGFEAYLTKPIDSEELIKLIQFPFNPGL